MKRHGHPHTDKELCCAGEWCKAAKCSECYSKCFVICENQLKLYKLESIKRKKPKEETVMQRKETKVSVKSSLRRVKEICMFCGRLTNKLGPPLFNSDKYFTLCEYNAFIVVQNFTTIQRNKTDTNL